MTTRAAAPGKAKTATSKIRKVPAPAPAGKTTETGAEKTVLKTAVGAAGDSSSVVSNPEMKKRELVDKVVERSDIKKKYAKPVVEAALAILGEALAEGRELNLQPMGKLKYNRTKETANARIIVAKIRQRNSNDRVTIEPRDADADRSE